MNISLLRPFPPFFPLSLLYYIRKHSFPHILYPLTTFFPHLCLPLYISIIYTLYIERSILSRNFLPLSYTFIILLLYIEEGTFYPPPFSPYIYIYSYKVNTFSTAHFITLIVWGKVCGEKFLKTLLV